MATMPTRNIEMRTGMPVLMNFYVLRDIGNVIVRDVFALYGDGPRVER